MLSFDQILNLDEPSKTRLGLEHIPREIAQQPKTWRKTAEIVVSKNKLLLDIFESLKKNRGNVVLSGAGTSEFIGIACQGPLRQELGIDVDSRATTDILTHSDEIFLRNRDYLVISFARSGNSPESVGSWRIAQTLNNLKQIAITCNEEGDLARLAGSDPDSLAVILPKETNDKSLVMTSSYTNMVVAVLGLAYLQDPKYYRGLVEASATAAKNILDQADKIGLFAQRAWKRGLFLGSGPLFGTARESHLKTLEISDGRIMTRYDSFLGLRHGPKVAIDNETFVLAFVSSNRLIQRYECDLLAELRNQGKVGGIIVVANKSNPELEQLADLLIDLDRDGKLTVEPAFRTATDVVTAQLLALFLSLSLELTPDNPSKDGTISRVVKGVKIYDHLRFQKEDIVHPI